jgi:hypothetical protein
VRGCAPLFLASCAVAGGAQQEHKKLFGDIPEPRQGGGASLHPYYEGNDITSASIIGFLADPPIGTCSRLKRSVTLDGMSQLGGQYATTHNEPAATIIHSIHFSTDTA